MPTLNKLSINGWDFYQWAYAAKWHKDNYGAPADLIALHSKWNLENAAAPPTMTDTHNVRLASKLIADFVGQGVIDQGIKLDLES